jgi:hypothetical protein
MSSIITYLPIFNLNILHNYFLDKTDKDGNIVVFDDTNKPEVLSTYNVSDFLRVVPSKNTQRVLKNHRVVFKTATNGATCFISVDGGKKPVIDATDVTVDLLIYSNDASLEKYTDLNTTAKGIYFFTNDPAEATNEIDALASTATNFEDYKVATSIDPNSKYQELLSALTGIEQRSLLGVVSIQLNDLLVGGTVGDPTEFKIALKNRKTVWVYLDQDGAVVSTTGVVQPLMHKGNIIPKDINDTIIPYRMATPFDAFVYPTDTNLPIETQVYI